MAVIVGGAPTPRWRALWPQLAFLTAIAVVITVVVLLVWVR